MLSRAVYLVCDCCGDPGQMECFNVTRRGAQRAAGTGWKRVRADGRVLDLCNRCTPNPMPESFGEIPAMCHKDGCRNPNREPVYR